MNKTRKLYKKLLIIDENYLNYDIFNLLNQIVREISNILLRYNASNKELKEIPKEVFEMTNLITLDLSKMF